MNKRIYNEARRNNVPAEYAAMIAKEGEFEGPFGAFPHDGATHTEGAITYKLSISNDDLSVFDINCDIEKYSRDSDLPAGALIIDEPTRNTYGTYITAETWADFWPAATDPKARTWLFERYAERINRLFESGFAFVNVTAFDPDGNELQEESCGGFDDHAYGAQEMFLQCKESLRRKRIAERKERRERAYWLARDVETVAA